MPNDHRPDIEQSLTEEGAGGNGSGAEGEGEV